MDSFIKLISETYGLAGLLILSPLIGMIYLWKHNQQLQTTIQELNDKVVEAQKQRVEDAQKVTEKLVEMVSEHAGLAKETNLALDRVGDTLSLLQNSGHLDFPARRGSMKGGS